jgi:hypothetical protein
VTFGTVRYAVAPGATAKLKVTLRAANRALLQRAKKIAVSATTTASDALGNTHATRRGISLRAAKP